MQSISPEVIFRGENAWQKSIPEIKKLTKRPLLIGRSESTISLRKKICSDLKNHNFEVYSSNLKFDCCYEDISRIKNIILKYNCDSIVAAGGGKVLDAGKLIADYLHIPVITVPLSASTCAGWTSLSNIYSNKGQFLKDVKLRSCPKIFIFDHGFINSAPRRTLASGIADALAKWYESSLTCSNLNDGLTQQAVQISRVLRDQLLINGESAYENQSEENLSWVNSIEGCGITAGLIGGIGGEKCRTAAAHAFHNAITQLEESKRCFHGEIVGVGILLQLRLEAIRNNNKLANQSFIQLSSFMKKLDLPTTILDLGINVFEKNNLEVITDFTCRDESEIHFLPFKIRPQDIVETIINVEKQVIKVK